MDDIEITFFESPTRLNFPDENELIRINSALKKYDSSCTIHLPTDWIDSFLHGGLNDTILRMLKDIIKKTRILQPKAYVLHLAKDGFTPNQQALRKWTDNAITLIAELTSVVENSALLAIENLYYPLEYNDAIIRSTECSYALDIGHLWHSKTSDWFNKVKQRLKKTAVLHVHSSHAGKDHQALKENGELLSLYDMCKKSNYNGIWTCELFGLQKTKESLNTMRGLWEK